MATFSFEFGRLAIRFLSWQSGCPVCFVGGVGVGFVGLAAWLVGVGGSVVQWFGSWGWRRVCFLGFLWVRWLWVGMRLPDVHYMGYQGIIIRY